MTHRRQEFPKAVRRAAWARCKGFCEKCGAKLWPGKFQYDHDIADALGGNPTLENCMVLCSGCHAEKTAQRDIPLAAKATRINDKHLGIKTTKRWSRWLRKVSGKVVDRETGERIQ